MKIKSLKSKIFLGYLLVVVILMGVTFWSIYNFTSLSDAINNIMVENYRSIKASESMIESLERQDSGMLMIINGHTEEGSATFNKNEQEFMKWFGRAEDNITIKGEKDIIDKVNDNFFSYINSFDKLKSLKSENQREFYYQQILPQFHHLKNNIRELRSINQNTMLNAQKKADSRANRAIISTIIISLSAIIMAILFGYYLSNLILKPVNDLKKTAQKVADRNFEQKINVKTDDEIGHLAREFNKMIERLQEYEKMNVNKLIAERDKSRAIVNNISSPLLVTDSDNNLILLNQEAQDLFDTGENYLNKHFLEIINHDKLFEIIKKAKNSNDTIKEREKAIFISKGKKDKEYHFKVSCSSVSTKEKGIEYTITLLEDVTKLKKIDDMKSEFVSTVSHEFRTPLTSMNMSLDMLLQEDIGDINEDQRELLTAAYEDCERLNELVDDLLDLSRIESGKIQMDFDKANVENIIKSTLNPFKNQAEEKNINLFMENINKDIYAYADSNKISWVISNLIGNALRYTPEEEGEIKVGAKSQGMNIYFYVEDNGVGIPEEYQDKIFDKFVRANNNEDGTSGTGLGLAISKEIVEAHNGSIWVESEEDKGTKFIFSVPRFRDIRRKEETDE